MDQGRCVSARGHATHLDDNDEDGPSNILNRQVGAIRPIE
jgi:hypothetical protein